MSGNIYNIVNAFSALDVEVGIIESSIDFDKYDKIVIPGVGAFPDAIKEINERNLREDLVKNINSKPTLGICLGMQILCTVGFEFEETNGLDVVKAEVRQLFTKGKIPRMGFGKLQIVKDSELFNDISSEDEFYFMHSFEVVNYTDVLALTEYSNHQYVCAFQKDNIYGVQFHPEKSRDAGLKLLGNFLKASN
jgi:imidazole glycerol phosphate synthase glutamine amidotransferase subunit